LRPTKLKITLKFVIETDLQGSLIK
jgi:hypothetical protein